MLAIDSCRYVCVHVTHVYTIQTVFLSNLIAELQTTHAMQRLENTKLNKYHFPPMNLINIKLDSCT